MVPDDERGLFLFYQKGVGTRLYFKKEGAMYGKGICERCHRHG